MKCSTCNNWIDENAHTVTIKNGIDYRSYIYNHFILCPKCYNNLKYSLEINNTPIEGPEDRPDIRWQDDIIA